MADRLNLDTVEQVKSENPFMGRSPQELKQILTMLETKQKEQNMANIKSRFGNFADTASNVFFQSGGIKPPEPKSNDMNMIIQKAILEDYIKSQTPEGKLARKKALFELGPDEGTTQPAIPAASQPAISPTPEITPTETAPLTTEKAPPQYIKKPSEKYPGYEIVENPDYKTYQTKQGKLGELDVKKVQLRDDLESFFAVDDLIDRAKGGFLDTKSAAFNTWWKSVDQPINPITGLPDPKGAAAATHAAASKRLRVQLVRAAGDVGNINIVEQEAAEKLIPRWGDSQSTAKLKRAYLRQIAKAINSGDENEVKKTLREMGVGFTSRGTIEGQTVYDYTPQGASTEQSDPEYKRYLELIGS